MKINGIFEDPGIFNNTFRNYLNIGEKLSVLGVALFVILILLLSDWQQCWRNRQTSQDHREKVKEDKIPQVHTHLGFHSSRFLKLNPEFANFRQCPMPARRPLGSASGSSGHHLRTSLPFEFRSFMSVWDAWSWSADQMGWMRDEAWYYVSFFE